MISAEQVDMEFAAHGAPREKAKQRVCFEISFICRDVEPYWLKDVMHIPVAAGDAVEDIDLYIVAGRDVWIDYDHSDPQCKTKARDLCSMLRASRRRPFRAAFIDRTDHLRVLWTESKGWTDRTPEGYDELVKQNGNN